MKSPDDNFPVLTANLAMEIFDLPVAFHRSLVTITGSVTAALMLSQAITWMETLAPEAEGWFSKSQAEWAEETGLSRWEQMTARKLLRACSLLEERKCGIPPKLWFRVNKHHLWQALRAASERGEPADS
jgi:hypothetical protein